MMLRFTKFAPVLFLAAGLIPLAAHAGPVAGRLPAPASTLSQGHFAANDPLAGERQNGYVTREPALPEVAQSSRLSQGHFSNTDPLAGERQQGPGNTAG